MVAEEAGGSATTASGDQIRLRLQTSGEGLAVSRTALAARAVFFAPLAEESGGCETEDVGQLEAALSPGARSLLPEVLVRLGSPAQPAPWQELLEDGKLLFTFAVAHLLGAAGLLDAARARAAEHDGRSLQAALSLLDVEKDAPTLRVAMDYGLDSSATSRLLHAAAAADLPAAVRVLAAETDSGDTPGGLAAAPVALRDGRGRTALHVCAVHNSVAAATELLQASADLNALCDPPDGDEPESDKEGASEEHRAFGEGHCGDLPKCPGIRTALHLAAFHDSTNMVELLLEARADVAICVKGIRDAVTPLHECAASDAASAGRVLAAAAAAAAAAIGETPWGAAPGAAAAAPDRGELADGGAAACPVADLGAAEPSAAPPPCGAAPDPSGTLEPPVQWSKFLDPLQAKVGPNCSTPLHVAAENDAPGVVAALLDAKADANVEDGQGDTPVHCAVLYAAPRALTELLARGADLGRENYAGELPLHHMATFGCGDSTAELPDNLLRRHFARSLRVQEILMEALRRRGQLAAVVNHTAAGDLNNTPLHAVARFGHLGAENAVRLLVEARAVLEQKNGNGRTPLAVAVKYSGAESSIARTLRSLGAAEVTVEADPLVTMLGGCIRPLLPLQPQAINTQATSCDEAMQPAELGEVPSVGSPELPLLGGG